MRRKRWISVILAAVIAASLPAAASAKDTAEPISFRTVSGVPNDHGMEQDGLHFNMDSREELYKGSAGFLYGVAEPNVPTIDLLQGLKPGVMVQKAAGGLQHPTGDAMRVRSALDAAGAKSIQVYLQDIYLEWPYNAPKKNGMLDVDEYTETCEKILYDMICSPAQEGDPGAFLGSDGNYHTLDENRAEKYSYVLFNEPDGIWFGTGDSQVAALEEAWEQVYRAIHAIDPDAKCAGPNFGTYYETIYDHFLSYCSEHQCLPEIITWHELGRASLTEVYRDYDSVRKLADTYYTEEYAQSAGRSYQPEFLINEYARQNDIATPGGLVKWITVLEDRDMDGCMAYWGMANSLNEIAAGQNSPSSAWWVYHWYAQMTGDQVSRTFPENVVNDSFYGMASYDGEIRTAYVLFGGCGNKNGMESVFLDRMDSTDLVGANGAAHVKVYGVGFSGQHGANYRPELIYDGAVSVTDDTLEIQIAGTDEMDACFAVVTPTDETGGAMEQVKRSTISLEAENARLLGAATVYNQNRWDAWAASGRKDVGNINKNGDGVEFTVNIPEDGIYDLGLFYSLQAPYVNPMTLEPDRNGQNRGIGKKLPFGMQVDNGAVQTLFLDSTITWSYRNHQNMDLFLTKGTHTISFTQINGDESEKGNLQLSATVDKIDLDLVYPDGRYDFTIDLTEMKAFQTGDHAYEVTAVAAQPGYYHVTGNGSFSLTRQSVRYAPDAKSDSRVSTYDIPVSDLVYLSKGANTIGVTGTATSLKFAYDADKTKTAGASIGAKEITIYGGNAYYREEPYADSGVVIAGLGVGEDAAYGETSGEDFVEFHVNAETAGIYNLAIRYTNDEPAPVMLKSNGAAYVHPYNIDLVERYAQIRVNGAEPETVYFRNTMSWETFQTVDVQADLNAGDNMIRIYNDNSYQFSPIVPSTAPEIDTITVTKQSYDGKGTALSADEKPVDTDALDEAVRNAGDILANEAGNYSDQSVEALRKALEAVSRETQGDVNWSRKELTDAIRGLKPKMFDYYLTGYASTNVGTPQNSFDGDPSTSWVASRGKAPCVAYEVFYAGDGKAFRLKEISMQSRTGASVIYLGTNSDAILKNPVEMGATSDLATSGDRLYLPFAELYDAEIIGRASGVNAVTPVDGQYRYVIVALTGWTETSVDEIGLSVDLVDTGGGSGKAHITIEERDGEIRADYTAAGETEELYAYLVRYDADHRVADKKVQKVTADTATLTLPATDDAGSYQAFLWTKDMRPVCAPAQ